MKKISREEQMEKNGGYYYWHCHLCKAKNAAGQLLNNRKAYSKAAAKSAGYSHSASHPGKRGFWDLGPIEDCPNA